MSKKPSIKLVSLFGWVLFSLSAFSLLACSASSTTKDQPKAAPASKDLTVFNWQDYIPEDVLNDFRKETGINLVYDTYGSNEDMYQKLINGAQYDVVFPSTDFVPRMIKKDLLAKLDTSKFAELANLDPMVTSKNTWDPKNDYSVPYNFGATAIMYWKDKVKVDNPSWSFLTKPELKNRIMLMDDPREVLGAALKFNGFSINSTKPEELEKAKKTVITWKRNIVKFDNDLIKSAFAKKEIFSGLNYPENQMAELDEADKANFGFFFPKEGGVMYLDVMTIMKNAKNVENAYTFINFILRPEVIARIYDAYGYPGIYPKATQFRKQKPWYSSADLKNHEFRGDIGDQALSMYEKAWEEIKVSK